MTSTSKSSIGGDVKNNGVVHALDIRVPEHWQVVQLENILDDIIGGGTPSRSNPAYWGGEIPWLTVKDMRSHRPEDSIDHISEEAVTDSVINIIPADTVIIATRIGLGKVIRVSYPAAINQDLKALIAKPGIDKGYLEYWIVSIAEYLQSIGSGTTVKGIRLEQLRSLPFPLAPEGEQKRIVSEIEKQFSRLDEAVASLKRTKANLKRYKAAVLKAAVEGKLTEDWRKQHPDIEPVGQLLERILAERRAKWNGKRRFKEPTVPDTSTLPDLPDRWCWAAMPQLGELNRGKSKHRPRNDPKLFGGPYPFIQTSDVKHSGGFVQSHSQTYNESGLAQSRLWPAGTLCITIAANIAETGILTYPACFPDSVVGFVFDSTPVTVRFIDLFFRTERDEIARFAPATAQKNINLEILSEVAVPFPPLEEQKEIVAEVERRMSVIDELEATVEANLVRADRLRQSILARAFSGSLRTS